MKSMNAFLAQKIDDEFYSEFDDVENFWCVFGNQSGFCYSMHCSEGESNSKARIMNKCLKESK